jgi:hypothetical protein
MISKINITLTYNNGKSARSSVNMPTAYTLPTGYTSINNTYPNITRPSELSTIATTEQYFTFSMPQNTDTNTTFNKSSIPTYFRLDLQNIVSTTDTDVEKLIVKNIQYEDITGSRSIIIKVENLDDDEIEIMKMKNTIADKVSRSKSLIEENDRIIDYIKQKPGRSITYTAE